MHVKFVKPICPEGGSKCSHYNLGYRISEIFEQCCLALTSLTLLLTDHISILGIINILQNLTIMPFRNPKVKERRQQK